MTVLVSDSVPELYATGPNDTICNNGVLRLHAETPDYAFEQGIWTVSPDHAGISISDTLSPDATVTGLTHNNSPYTFYWTVANGCGSVYDSLLVVVSDSAAPLQADAGPDMCLPSDTTQVTMVGSNPAPGDGLWSIISRPGVNLPTITYDTAYNTNVTGMDENGTYVFEWHVSCVDCGCPDSRDTVLITIDDPVTPANAGPDITLCGDSTRMAGNQPTVGTGEWTFVIGNGGYNIKDASAYNTDITGLIDGTYKFRWTITNGACSSEDSLLIFVSNDEPSQAVAGDDKDVCGDSFVAMTATTPTSGTGTWTQYSGPNTAIIASIHSPATDISELITGEYRFVWTVTAGDYCAPSSDTVNVNVVRLANAGDDREFCDSISAVILTGTVGRAK